MLSTLIFFTANPAPATHFAALGRTVSSKYDVSYIAAGNALGKLNEKQVQAIDFNPEKLDLSQEAVQIKLAEEMAKTCFIAKIIIVDVGHLISAHLQKAVVAYTQRRGEKPPLFIGYYENSESWVPGGYSKTAAQVISVCQAIFFANCNLVDQPLYQDQNSVMDLKSIPRFAIGYSPIVEDAEKVLQERLNIIQYEKARSHFFNDHRIEDNGQKILVYIGENNSTYFEQALPQFLDFIEEGSAKNADLANSIILFQLHPNAKSRKEEERLLIERKFAHKPHLPKCLISDISTHTALVLARVVLGRQSSTVYQAVLGNCPYMQVAREKYDDIAMKSGYPHATSVTAFIEVLQNLFSSFTADPERRAKVLTALGIQANDAENFENALQIVSKSYYQ